MCGYRKIVYFFCVAVMFDSTFAAFTAEQIELMNNLHAECISKTGATEDQVANAKKGNFADDTKLKCYIKCIFEEVGVINDDGTLDTDGLLAMLPEEAKAYEDLMKSCNTASGTDSCDTIWNIHKCYYAKMKDDYFLP